MFSKGCRKSALALSDGLFNSVCSFQQQSDHLSQLELWELIHSLAFKCVKSYVHVRSRIGHDHFNILPRALGPYIWSDRVFIEQPKGVPKVSGRSRTGNQELPPLPGSAFVPLYAHPQQKPCQCFPEAAVGNSDDGNIRGKGRAVVTPKELTLQLGQGQDRHSWLVGVGQPGFECNPTPVSTGAVLKGICSHLKCNVTLKFLHKKVKLNYSSGEIPVF